MFEFDIQMRLKIKHKRYGTNMADGT